MRDGSARRLVTRPEPRTWTPARVQVQHWRERHRHETLHALVDGARGLGWTGALVTTLLDELHVTDEFDRFVGPLSRVPVSQYPRLIAIAVLLRHSWSPHDLGATARAMGLGTGAADDPLTSIECACFRRQRRTARTTSNNGRRTS